MALRTRSASERRMESARPRRSTMTASGRWSPLRSSVSVFPPTIAVVAMKTGPSRTTKGEGFRSTYSDVQVLSGQSASVAQIPPALLPSPHFELSRKRERSLATKFATSRSGLPSTSKSADASAHDRSGRPGRRASTPCAAAGPRLPVRQPSADDESQKGPTLRALERRTGGDGQLLAASSGRKEAEPSSTEKLKHPNCKGDPSQEWSPSPAVRDRARPSSCGRLDAGEAGPYSGRAPGRG